jgi:large subunit ribosomal protein L4
MTSVAEYATPIFKGHKRELVSRQVDRRAADGAVLGTVDLDPAWFGAKPNVPLMHQVVVAQLAAARSGTQSTKTRAEVAGGGAKPFRQKGMGRSRQGSIRAPQWVGGGIAFGPKPRSYKQKTPKKMIRQSLISALSDRVLIGRVALVDQWTFDVPKTKEAVSLLNAFGLTGRVFVVLGPDDVVAERSFGNLPRIQTLQASELNTYDVLKNDWILFTDDSLPGGVGDVSGHKHPEPVKAVAAIETPAKTRKPAQKKAAVTETADEVAEAADEDTEATDSTEASADADAATTSPAVAETDEARTDEAGPDEADEDES